MLYECLGVAAGLAITLYVAVQLWSPWIHYDIAYLWTSFKVLRRLKMKIRRRELIVDSFEQQVRERPAKTLVIFEDEPFTYEAVDRHANQVARQGLRLGLGPNDVVALMMYNEPEFLWTFLGLQKIGVSVSLINYHLRLKSLLHCIQSCKPKVLIVGRGAELEEALNEIRNDVTDDHIDVHDYDALMTSDDVDCCDPVDPRVRDSVRLSDVSSFIFTSGTTGLPKPAVITHRRVLMAIIAFDSFDFGVNDVLYETLPLYHAAGLNLGVLAALSKGATCVLGRKFSVSKFWSDVRKHHVTVIQYIGEMCRYLVNSEKADLDGNHDVRVAVGNGLRADIWDQFQHRFKIPKIYEFYASTEGNASFCNIFNKVGVVGRLSPLLSRLTLSTLVQYDCTTQQPVRNSDGRCTKVGPGKVGLLICSITDKTPFEGYYKRPEETEKSILHDVFRKGDVYLNSGDLFYVDSEYFLYFQDRTGDTYRWKGENVSTSEVANIMSELDFVHDVNVYGVKVPGCEGKAGMAAVYLKDGDQMDSQQIEMMNHRVHDHLPSYARPRFLRVQRQMSLTSTYKQQKVDLVEEAFDPHKVHEPLYYYDSKNNAFKPLVDTVFEDIVAGKVSV
ncbi:very long-chain acyl-CoA synthetase-like isoform X2 [Gigantopelta aegis]|nr:very long-chain acyl-CoA synthetase-like isoform X2 [Gigantopelta aegis]